MALISVKSLLEAGVHFGHRASRWNPKMEPYIFGKRNLIHIINLRETVKGLVRSYHFLNKMTAEGHQVLFVGTKKQARKVVKEEAAKCGMHYVSERWLGGTLTNFTTIRKRLNRLEELETMEEDGTMASLSKKLASSLRRERKKIQRNLEGIRNMNRHPSVLVVIDPQKEKNAVLEAAKLNIPVIALMDTDSDPTIIDIPIPGNDDAMRSIEVILSKLTEAISAGTAKWEEHKKLNAKQTRETRTDDDRDDRNKRRKRGGRKRRKPGQGRPDGEGQTDTPNETTSDKNTNSQENSQE